MAKAETLKFSEYEVTVEPEYLRFDEASLSKYIQDESSWYDNYGAYLALAERHLQNKEVAHEKIYCERFVEAKENGSSDKLAEAKAKSDMDVNELREEIVEAKYVVNRLKNHLKAWDKNHENAQSMGHMQRKIMDKLNGDIRMSGYGTHSHPIDNHVEAAIKSGPGEFADTLDLDSIRY